MPARVDELDEAECLRLLGQSEVGRIAFHGRFGLSVLPVNYRWHEGTVVFRTEADSALGQDLRTGIADAEYQVAFEVDDFSAAERAGWSVLIQGSAHHVDTAGERESVERAGVDSWAGGHRNLFIRIIPRRVTGRRIHPGAGEG